MEPIAVGVGSRTRTGVLRVRGAFPSEARVLEETNAAASASAAEGGSAVSWIRVGFKVRSSTWSSYYIGDNVDYDATRNSYRVSMCLNLGSYRRPDELARQ